MLYSHSQNPQTHSTKSKRPSSEPREERERILGPSEGANVPADSLLEVKEEASANHQHSGSACAVHIAMWSRRDDPTMNYKTKVWFSIIITRHRYIK